MNGTQTDILRYETSEGGEVKITLSGYMPGTIEELLVKYEDLGWTLTSHDSYLSTKGWASVRDIPRRGIPSWVAPFVVGGAVANIVNAIIELWNGA